VDCEKFDRIVLDLLYGELDELTSAAGRRHMEHCTRCRNIGSGLRATREVGVLPLVEAPDGLELRILAAEEQATQLLPIRKRLGRALSLLAGYAMRPQLAMAALLMLMIGSSLFFLHAQPGDREHVLVTERGVPESDNEPVVVIAKKTEAPEPARAAARPAPVARAEDANLRRDRGAEAKAEIRAAAPREVALAPPSPLSAPDRRSGAGLGMTADDKDLEGASRVINDSDASYDAAMAAYRDGRYSEAQRRFDEIASLGGPHAANAALYEVEALRRVSGCPSAAPRFEDVHTRYPGSVGNDAAWQAADCYRSLGELARARQNYESLSADPSYKSRAKEAIAELDQRVADQEIAARKAAAASKAGAAAAPASKAGAAAAPAKPAASAQR
jgi:TolA-binding protein